MILFHRISESDAAAAKADPWEREKFITENEQTILKIASKACGRYVSKSDDEWSVALYAFSRAIDSYETERGSFMSFAATVIQRALIDYHRNAEHYSAEVSFSPAAFEGNGEENEADAQVTYAVAAVSMAAAEHGAREEIAALSSILNEFGFGFMDLTENSPKQDRTRQKCLDAAKYLASDTGLYRKMMESHHLPASDLTERTGVPPKILDKYRKYIIAAAIILSDDYPCLAEYLKPRKGGQQT